MQTKSRWVPLLGAAAVLLLGQGRASAQNVTVGGLVYAQYGYQLADTADQANAFDVKRAYLDVRGKFDGGISTRITSDIHRDPSGSLNLRLKYAYVTWTPENSPITLKFGQIHTPWLDWEEHLWEYRMQGTMPLERAGYITSADLGAGLDGAWADQKVNVQVVAINGEGYHGAEGDRHKDVAARGSLRLLSTDDGSSVGGLRLTGMAHVGRTVGGGTRDRFVGMLSYKSSLVTLAGQAGRVVNSPTSADPDVKANVMSVYGVLNPRDSRLALVGRVDVWDPDTDQAEDRSTRFIAGVSYQLSPNVLILVDLDHVSYQGSPPTASAAAQRSNLLFQTQFTF
ncbi:MAG: porin [Gemmatimonadota bacterium]